GACGYFLPEAFVFYLTALLTFPALAVIRPLVGIGDARPPVPQQQPRKPRWSEAKKLARLMGDRRLLVFALSVALFTFANAAMLPLAGSTLTKRAGGGGRLFIAGRLVVPHGLAAVLPRLIGA